MKEWSDETKEYVLKFLEAIAEGVSTQHLGDRHAAVFDPYSSDDTYLVIDTWSLRDNGTIRGMVAEDFQEGASQLADSSAAAYDSLLH